MRRWLECEAHASHATREPNIDCASGAAVQSFVRRAKRTFARAISSVRPAARVVGGRSGCWTLVGRGRPRRAPLRAAPRRPAATARALATARRGGALLAIYPLHAAGRAGRSCRAPGTFRVANAHFGGRLNDRLLQGSRGAGSRGIARPRSRRLPRAVSRCVASTPSDRCCVRRCAMRRAPRQSRDRGLDEARFLRIEEGVGPRRGRRGGGLPVAAALGEGSPPFRVAAAAPATLMKVRREILPIRTLSAHARDRERAIKRRSCRRVERRKSAGRQSRRLTQRRMVEAQALRIAQAGRRRVVRDHVAGGSHPSTARARAGRAIPSRDDRARPRSRGSRSPARARPCRRDS